MAHVVALAALRRKRAVVFFSRGVLAQQWRDYSIDNQEGYAAFGFYRRAHDAPVYTVYRFATGSNPNGDYLLIRGNNWVRQGKSLVEVLVAITPSLRAVESQSAIR